MIVDEDGYNWHCMLMRQSTWREHKVGGVLCCHLTFKNQTVFLKQKTQKKTQIKKPSSNLEIPPKLTRKCCIILHQVQT